MLATHNAGVHDPVYGPALRLESRHFVSETSILVRRKIDAGDGFAFEQSMYAGHPTLMGGFQYRYQTTSVWSKPFLFPSVLVRARILDLTLHGPDLLSGGSRYGLSATLNYRQGRLTLRPSFGYTELNHATSVGVAIGFSGSL